MLTDPELPSGTDRIYAALLEIDPDSAFDRVINLQGEDRRYVFHGVHMMFDGRLERPWGKTERGNTLVFIGRDLDRAELEAGLHSCFATGRAAAS